MTSKILNWVAVLAVALSSALTSNTAQAWGERGHDVITRVAVQNLRHLTQDNDQIAKPFKAKDHMLGHLSNTPDTVWRADYQTELVLEVNSPTHYINLEKVYQGIALWSDLPREFSQYTQDCRASNYEPKDVGTAPWRVMQLYVEMVEQLKRAGQAQDRDQLNDAVNSALLYAGVMAHFVGDLSNPHHTTANYDGQLTGQKGLHGYFEHAVVSELGLDIAARVERQAKKNWLKQYGKKERKEILADPQKLVWALVGNSHSRLPELLRLDQKYSLISPSKDEKSRAERKAPKAVAKRYQKFAVERLGAGAAALSQLWLLAWQEAGKPDLSSFRSYHYSVKPEFIHPEY